MASIPSRYANVGGFFAQADTTTDPSTFDYIKQNFGLKASDSTLTPRKDWGLFKSQVEQLNKQGQAKGEVYKVLYCARHGEGEHNLAEQRYGTLAWDDHWSKLDGDETLHWADPHLTETGIFQAREAHNFYRSQLEDHGMPAPESFYTSPLYRCMATCNITFAGQDLDESAPFVPHVKELLRETNGVHTCDQRSTKSSLQKSWPQFQFEPGFTDDDELWRPDHRETNDELDARIQAVFDDIFENDSNTFISLTTHSGAIQSILRVIGHRVFQLPTGGAIPMLVRRF